MILPWFLQAEEAAGAVLVEWAQQVDLLRVRLLNNTAKTGSAGGIAAGNTRLLQMQDVLVQGNKVNFNHGIDMICC
jgi:hypothetical protein